MQSDLIEKLKKDYEPIVKQVEDLCGLSMNTALPGENVKVLQKAFFTSYEEDHQRYFDGILSPFVGTNTTDCNQLLVVIRENKAKIFTKHPLVLKIKSKVDIKKFQPIFKGQILDIEAVEFKDDLFDLDVKDGDKFLWLFRKNWSFGLYYDFSKNLKVDLLWSELGECYRKLEFYSLYSFLSRESDFDKLIEKGWFPFIQIIGSEFDQLRKSIDSEKELSRVENYIGNSFTKERITNLSDFWWRNSIFNNKKDLIQAGLTSFLRGDDHDIINCIKTLSSEIEGIIRIDYHNKYKTKPTTKELKDYVVNSGKSKFGNSDSLGFPGLFLNYLDKVLFRGFDVEKNDCKLSRHSVGHGVAPKEEYTKARALQLILSLDQIYFYLRK